MTSWRTRIAGPALAAALSITMGEPALAQRGNPQMAFAGQSIDEMVADFMAEHAIPGLALAIVQAPYIPRVTGYGLADVGKKLLVSSNTLFDLGQMIEAYTGVAIMQLVEQGRLGLDDPASHHLPDLPGAWSGITVRHLLMHASGLRDYREAVGAAAAPAAAIAGIAGLAPAFAPGTDVAASATDYLLLGLIVEAASGQSYRDFVQRNQIERLGLRHTVFAQDLGQVKRESVETSGGRHAGFLADPALVNPTEPATGYAGEGGRDPVPVRVPPAAFLPGGLLASAQDVSLWDIGLAGAILVKEPANRALLYGGARLADGRAVPVMGGWRFPGHKGLMYVIGSTAGQSAFLSRFTDPDELVCVTLLVNREGIDLSQLARRIAGAYDTRLGPPQGAPGMRARQSPFGVAETIGRLEAVLKQGGVGIMARIDHAAGARSAGIDLPATEQLIFGNPAAGTPLMLSRRSVALDLPLRALAWEENGAVWLGYTDPVEIAHRNGVVDRDPQALTMRHRLDAATLKAVTPY